MRRGRGGGGKAVECVLFCGDGSERERSGAPGEIGRLFFCLVRVNLNWLNTAFPRGNSTKIVVEEDSHSFNLGKYHKIHYSKYHTYATLSHVL